ncbi:MAG: photosystem reaction center subunit H [Candidatus Rokuibacteriota bacterium]|nr:MAG: photosystem reaction center subunit H [Candidatus Rokubacteria bacterium]
MRWIESLLLALLVILTPNVYVSAQVAGSTSLGVTAEELRAVAVGWSAKKQVLGKTVYNENKEKVGAIDDLIIAPDRAVSFAIIGAGGFVGLGRHDVAIPVTQLKQADDGKILLPGATKQAIKAMPRFEYAKAK